MSYTIKKESQGKEIMFNLLEVSTNEIVYSSTRRPDVLNKKKKLESWKEKQKRKWNG